MRKYIPRRASRRWLEDAPDYILDCFDNPKFGDRYTVFFTNPYIYYVDDNGKCVTGSDRIQNTYIQYIGCSESPSHSQGISIWNEMKAYDAANYRIGNFHRRISWLSIPENVRDHIKARAEKD